MNPAGELARLNLVLELVTECASLVDADDVARTVGVRLHWIVEFDRCELALDVNGTIIVSGMGAQDDGLKPVYAGLPGAVGRSLIEEALAHSAPASAGRPISAVAYPLGPVGQPLGALFVSAGKDSFTHRELRLLQHISSSLGGVLSRIRRELLLQEQRSEAAVLAEASRREREAKDDAIASNAAKDEFMAMLGHELRNPLAPILSSTALLRQEVGEAQIRRVDVIERQALHLQRLVADLLDVSRITSGKVTLRRAATDLRKAATNAAEITGPEMDARNQVLDLELPPVPAPVNGDEVRLTQVVTNLLANASRYSGAGTRVRLSIEPAGPEYVITVADEGIGMSAATLASAFDKFVQGRRGADNVPGGLGLGLAVAKSLVDIHGGRIAAESAGEGQGSVFRVWLPALARDVDLAAARVAPASPAQACSSQPLRILLVDDNADAADLLGEILQLNGYVLKVAHGPVEALRVAPGFAPDVAILDIGMAVMDGRALAMELRARLPAPLRMIALSGYGQEIDRQHSLTTGFQAHLVKPVDLPQLLDEITRQP